MKTKKSILSDPHRSLFAFGDDVFTPSSLSKNVFISGGTGSGKSSGPIRFISKNFFKLGYGGLITCAKPDDATKVKQLAKESGREKDLIVVDATGQHTINWLEYENQHVPEGSSPSITTNQMISIGREVESTVNTAPEEAFWVYETERFIGFASTLLRFAKEPVSAKNIYIILASAATNLEQLQNDQFLTSSNTMGFIEKAIPFTQHDIELDMAIDYFLNQWTTMDSRTKSNVRATLNGILYPLVIGLPSKIIDDVKTTFTPETTTEGKIILLDLPYSVYREQGSKIQAIITQLFMQSMLRRDLTQNSNYTFLICDELPLFLTKYHTIFNALSRSNHVMCVYATQSLSALITKLGGENAREAMYSLLGNLVTKIFLSHNEFSSNQYSADTIGKDYDIRTGTNISASQGMHSASTMEELRHFITPHELTLLKNGGPYNNFLVEAIIVEAGRIFSNGKTYKKVAFSQNF